MGFILNKRIRFITAFSMVIGIVGCMGILLVNSERVTTVGGVGRYVSAMKQLNIEQKSMATIYSSDDVPLIDFVVKRGDYEPFINLMKKNGYSLTSKNGRDLFFSKGDGTEHYYVQYLTGDYDLILTAFPYDYFNHEA